MGQKRVILRPGREKAVLGRHPWIFSGAIDRVAGDPAPGDVVEVLAADGRFLARGLINQRSQITVRLYTWDQSEPLDESLWANRLVRAIAMRESLGLSRVTTAYRLVHAESDLLPGLIVDRYGDFLVLQALTLGVERWKPVVVQILDHLLHPVGIYERSDVEVRQKEGLEPASGVLLGEEPPPLLEIQEYGHRFLVNIRRGHKTGFYLDQRENRRRVAAYCVGKEVLNVFAYTGAFGVYAAVAGATRVVHVESSAEALDLARRHVELNHSDLTRHHFAVDDAFNLLRVYRSQGQGFDVVILDPPKFADSVGQLKGALRGYKDINLLAMHLLRPGGMLVTFSCSGAVSPGIFQQVVWEASLDARRDVQIVERFTQGPDHPVLLTFPEGEYLKGFALKVA